jgi:uncharacterized iron-regulated protein
MKLLRFILIYLLLFLPLQNFAQELKAYQLFDNKGKRVKFGKLVKQSSRADVVLFGELHNNPISHWLQLELTKALYDEKGERLILGAEMFETDNQLIIDEYFHGLITERNFRADGRFWNNYETDIKPVLEFARENSLRYIATNIPRRYASLVSRQGFEGLDSLDQEAFRYIAPLPVAYDPELPGYKAMLNMTGMPAHAASDNFPKAQAIKDATMAHFIMKNFEKGDIFLHFHGTYHSNNYEGIVWYLNKIDNSLKLLTIATVQQDSVDKLNDENKGLADFIIVTPSTMTKTY